MESPSEIVFSIPILVSAAPPMCSAVNSPRITSPLCRVHRAKSALRKSQTFIGGEDVRSPATLAFPHTGESPNILVPPGDGGFPTLVLPCMLQAHEAAPARDSSRASNEFPSAERSSAVEGKRPGFKRSVNPKVSRMLDAAVDHFGYKKRPETAVEETRPQFEDRRSVESDSLDEATETIDRETFARQKREAQDLRKELAKVAKACAEQEHNAKAMEYEVRCLRAKVQNPAAVPLVDTVR